MKKLRSLPRWLVWVLVLELLFMAVLTVRLTKPVQNLTVHAADMESTTPEPLANLQYPDGSVSLIDTDPSSLEGMASGDPASVPMLYASLPALNAGRYEVTVHYAADSTPESTAAGQVVFQTGQAVDVSAAMTLEGTVNTFTGHFWLLNAVPAQDAGVLVYACNTDFRFISLEVRELWSWRLVQWISAAVVFAALDLVLLWLRRADKHRRMVFAALAATVFFVSLPCLGGFAPYGSDLHYHMSRVAGIAEGLRTGQFPVFLYPDFLNGYGYASPIFYGEALLYIPALLVLAGYPLFTAYNIFNVLVNALTVGVCSLCLHKIFRRRLPAFVGSFLYACCNYRLFNLYWRQAAGEITAQLFLPVVLYGFWALYADDADEKQRKGAWLPLLIGFTGLVQSHLLTTEITALAAVVLVLACWRRAFRPDRLLILLKGAVLSVLLNLGFLVPFLSYMGGDYRITDTASVNSPSATAVNWSMLLDFWTPTNMDTLRLGAGLVLGVVLYILLRLNGADRKTDQLCLPCLLCAAVCIYMCSSFDWANFSNAVGQTLAHYACAVQFPFRFLVLASPCLCFVAAAGVARIQTGGGLSFGGRKAALACAACLLAVALVPAWLDVGQYLRGDYGRDRVGESRELDSGKVSSALEYLPVNFDPETSDSTALVAGEGVEAVTVERRGLSITMDVTNHSGADAMVELPLIDYPGYRITRSDGGTASLAGLTDGRLGLVVADGYAGLITVAFVAPMSWRGAELISALTLLALLVWGWRRYTGRGPLKLSAVRRH